MDMDPNQFKLMKDILPKKFLEKLLNPSADVVGQGLAGIFYFVFQHPMKFGIIKRKELSDLASKTYEEISNIPYEHRDNDKLGLTLKSLEDSRYSLDDNDMRSWFSRLISSSVDDRKNSSLSPYYSTILSNLNGDSARFLLNFKKLYYINQFAPCPVAKVIGGGKSRGYHDVLNNLVYWDYLSTNFSSLTYDVFSSNVDSIDDSILNVLSSFNIINITYDSYPGNDMATDTFNFFEHYKPFTDLKNNSSNEIKIQKGLLSLTEFGKSFVDVAMPNY